MITVFGSINLDILIRVPKLPVPGETVVGSSYALAPGGKGANQALAAFRAGAKVRLIGAVGRDAFAEPALELLREDGLDLSLVRRSLVTSTGIATIAIDAKGENQIAVASGANAEVSAEDIPEEALDRWSILLMQMELPPKEVVKAIARARAMDVRVVLNFAPAIPIPEASLDAVDVLILNQVEGTALAQSFALSTASPTATASAIADRRERPVVLTAGSDGVYVAQPHARVVHIPAPPVDVVDTTGAGDAFVGAFVAALDLGMPITEAASRGIAAGALACGRVGGQPSMPSKADIEALAEQLADY